MAYITKQKKVIREGFSESSPSSNRGGLSALHIILIVIGVLAVAGLLYVWQSKSLESNKQ